MFRQKEEMSAVVGEFCFTAEYPVSSTSQVERLLGLGDTQFAAFHNRTGMATQLDK